MLGHLHGICLSGVCVPFSSVCFRTLQTRRQAAKGATASKKRAAEDDTEDQMATQDPAASPAKRLKTGTHAYVVCNLFNLTVCCSCDPVIHESA
jgi:hypothetical protein